MATRLCTSLFGEGGEEEYTSKINMFRMKIKCITAWQGENACSIQFVCVCCMATRLCREVCLRWVRGGGMTSWGRQWPHVRGDWCWLCVDECACLCVSESRVESKKSAHVCVETDVWYACMSVYLSVDESWVKCWQVVYTRAVSEGAQNIVRLLLQGGASLTLKNREGLSPVQVIYVYMCTCVYIGV